MSYENPTRAIDTQSAQHFANLQNSLTGSFLGIAKNYKADQAARTKKLNEEATAIDKIKKGNQIAEDNILTEMYKKGTKAPGLNMDVWIKAIDRYNDIKNRIDLGTEDAETIAKLRQEAAEIRALPTTAVGAIQTFTEGTVDLEKSLDNVGKMGGADQYGNSTIIKDLQTWMGKSTGERNQVVEKNKAGTGWDVDIIVNGNRYTSEQLNNLKRGNGELVATVPNETKNFDNYTALLKGKNADTGKIEFSKEVFGDAVTREEDGYLVSYKPVNKDFIKEKVGDEIDGAIAAMSNSQKAIFYNNIIAKRGQNDKLIDESMNAESFNDPENQKLFREGYEDKWFSANVGEEQVLSRVKIPAEKELTHNQKLAAAKNAANKFSAGKAFSGIMTDVQDSLGVTGLPGKYNPITKIVEFTEKVKYEKELKGGKIETVTEDVGSSWDLNTKTGMQDYVNAVVDNSDEFKGQSNGVKRAAVKKMVGKYFKELEKKKKEAAEAKKKKEKEAEANRLAKYYVTPNNSNSTTPKTTTQPNVTFNSADNSLTENKTK